MKIFFYLSRIKNLFPIPPNAVCRGCRQGGRAGNENVGKRGELNKEGRKGKGGGGDLCPLLLYILRVGDATSVCIPETHFPSFLGAPPFPSCCHKVPFPQSPPYPNAPRSTFLRLLFPRGKALEFNGPKINNGERKVPFCRLPLLGPSVTAGAGEGREGRKGGENDTLSNIRLVFPV